MKRTKRADRRNPGIAVTYTVTPEQEYDSPEGQFASGDDEADARMVADIRRDHESGNEWAWCCVKVTARVEIEGEKFEGVSYLGGCSYKDEADFCHPEGYWLGMKDDALEDLIRNVRADASRGTIANKLIRRLT